MSGRTRSSRSRLANEDVSVDDLESELDQLISPSFVNGQLQPYGQGATNQLSSPSKLTKPTVFGSPVGLHYGPNPRSSTSHSPSSIPSRMAIKQMKSTSAHADEYPDEWDASDLVAFGGGTHGTALLDSDEEVEPRRPLNGTLHLDEDDMQYVNEVNAWDDGSWVFIDGVYKKVALNDKALRPPPLVPEHTPYSFNKRKPHAMLRPSTEADPIVHELESKLSGLQLERDDIVVKCEVQQIAERDTYFDEKYAAEREERRRRRKQKQIFSGSGLRSVNEESGETTSTPVRSKRSSIKGDKNKRY